MSEQEPGQESKLEDPETPVTTPPVIPPSLPPDDLAERIKRLEGMSAKAAYAAPAVVAEDPPKKEPAAKDEDDDGLTPTERRNIARRTMERLARLPVAIFFWLMPRALSDPQVREDLDQWRKDVAVEFKRLPWALRAIALIVALPVVAIEFMAREKYQGAAKILRLVDGKDAQTEKQN